jgi:hypothetical protein
MESYVSSCGIAQLAQRADMTDKHSTIVTRNPDARNTPQAHDNAHSEWARNERSRRLESLRISSLDASGQGIVDWEQSFQDEATENSRRYWANLPDPSYEAPSAQNDRFRFDLGRLFRRVWSEIRHSGR